MDRRSLLAMAALCAAAPLTGRTQGTAPIRLIVPFTPGTGIDLIAEQTGFTHSHYLQATFKARYKQTPGKFRRAKA